MAAKYPLIVILALVAAMPLAQAAEKDQSATGAGGADTELGSNTAVSVATNQPIFKFGGFGTLGISHSSQGLGNYTLDRTFPKGAGRSSDWFAGNDSRIAANLTANFAPKVSAILQVVSEYQAEGNYRPAVEWANVKYAFTPEAYIRIGRIALPTFLNSDNRDVGYSYPWITPPVDLYRQMTIMSSDGVDAKYRFDIGGAVNSIRAIYGRDKLDLPTSISTSKNLRGIFDTVEYGFALFHVGYQKRDSSSLNLLTGVIGTWTQDTDLSVGASYDPGNWFVMSEWIQRQSTTKVGAMYISGGLRADKFTPYMTYSQISPGSFLAGSPVPKPASIQNAQKSEATVSLGVRWDFMKNTDFKLQYDLVKLGANSNGYLANVPANVILYGTKFHVISAVVDFVF